MPPTPISAMASSQRSIPLLRTGRNCFRYVIAIRFLADLRRLSAIQDASRTESCLTVNKKLLDLGTTTVGAARSNSASRAIDADFESATRCLVVRLANEAELKVSAAQVKGLGALP